tara:strand:+ start:10355 stop:13405 length:3051 start_codon:yes stop_codon:yes gene_type:complete
MANSFKQTQQEAIALIKEVEAEVKKLDVTITNSATKLSKMLKVSSGGNDINAEVQRLNAEMLKLNKTIGQQQSQIKRLANVRAQSNKKTSEEVVNQRALAKASDLEAKSKSKIVGAYQRLNAQRNIAKKRLQDLIVSQGKNAAATKKAQREYDKYTNKINKANKATANFSKSGIGGLLKGFRNLLGAFGITGAIYMFAQFTQSGFKLAKQLDSLNFAMKTIITDSEELSQTQSFLLDITERYGAELVTTTERYIKFLTAAKQSNVSLSDTEQIFRSVTKAAGVLGLSTEELNGTYLALEQMLSKGKVTTEELRRQLGERLPGAFGIMADAIGVTVEELDKMLKKGEILSADALPKFAKALEKAYGIENITNVRTLQAETSRLSNAWTRFVQNVTESDGVISRALMNVLSFITEIVKGIELLNTSQEKIDNRLQKEVMIQAYEKTKIAIEKVGGLSEKEAIKSADRTRDRIEEIESEINKLNELKEISSSSYTSVVNENGKREVIKISELITELNKSLGFNQGELKALEEILVGRSKLKDIIADETDGRRTLSVVMSELAKEQKNLQNSTKEEASTVLNKIKLLQEEAKAWREKNSKQKRAKELIEGTVKWYQKEISALKQKRDELSKNNEQYEEFNNQIDNLQKRLDKIIGTYDEFKNIINSANEGTEKADDLVDNLILGFDSWQRGLKDTNKELENTRASIENFMRSFSDEAMSNFGFDTFNELLTLDENGKSIFSNLLEQAKESGTEFEFMFNSIAEVGQEAFNFLQQNQQAYFDNLFYNLEQERDIAIQFAGDSATAREEIERQYEEKRRAIQQKQAEAERDQAIFNIAIDTAQGVVSALASTPPNVPLSIAVGLIGAAQLALVKSTPLPEFFRGTENAPEGFAMVDEKRPEIHTDRQGNIKSFGESKANVRWLSQGDKIYKSREEYFNKELTNILGSNDILPYTQMFDMVAPSINIENGISKQEFVRGIDKLMSKETAIINLDKNGFATSVRKGSVTKHKQNNILKLKGNIV